MPGETRTGACTLDADSCEPVDGCMLPIAGDDCCPSGATAATDADCAAVCGNGVVESGETCDPCPSSCDDQDVCTTDARSGEGCDRSCTHEPTEARSGDGCCPPAGNANNDNDCSPRCGNGVVEAGEACDGDGRCGMRCEPVLPDSLLHRYSFNEAGPTARDSVGGADGTVINTSLSGDGILELTGVEEEQYVDLPDGLISALNDVSAEVWVTWHGGSDLHRVFDFGMNSDGVGANSGRGSSYFYLSPRSTAGTLLAAFNFTPALDDYFFGDYQRTADALEIGVRRHVVVAFRDPGPGFGKTMTLYVDGIERGSLNVPPNHDGVDNRLSNLDDRNAWIGRANYAIPSISASIDEFRIYDRALDGPAVAASFRAGPDP